MSGGLLVEDTDDVSQCAKSALEELGYKVLVAHDSAGVLRIVNDGTHIDLLFTVIVRRSPLLCGGMNGRRLSHEVLKARPGLAVLFTTGYTPNPIIHHSRLDPDVQLFSKQKTWHAQTWHANFATRSSADERVGHPLATLYPMLVQAAERPDQQQDRDRDSEQPEQSVSTHFFLLILSFSPDLSERGRRKRSAR